MKFLLAPVALVIFAGLPTCARAQTAPLLVPDAARLRLDDIGLYAAGYRYRGQEEQRFPVGWSENFEKKTGVSLQSAGVQNGREAFLLHPPWHDGTGTAFQEFRFQLPPIGTVRKITLCGATTMRSDALAAPGAKPKSDGVTFRVWANGRELLNEPRADANWKPFEFDLSSLAGQTLVLRFGTDPGSRDDPSFDFALWGDRELRLEGFAPKIAVQPAPPPLDLKRLLSVQNGNVAPPSGFAGTLSTHVNSNKATFRYSGADGSLQYEWTRPRIASDPPLGVWRLRARQQGATSVQEVALAGDAHLEWTKPAKFLSSRMESASGGGATCVSTFDLGGRTATLRLTAHLSGKSLVVDARCDEPQLASFNAGRFGPVMRRRAVALPYYSGQVFYLAKENLFVNAFLDWTTSSASSQEKTSANYGARTDGTRATLRERAVFCAAWHAAETFPNVPNPPSPFRAMLGNKIVLDFWGGQFGDIARTLQTLHDSGIDNCVAIIHVWQRSGYGNALPAHVPANAGMGGESEMKNLVATAKRLGYKIALHENYVDYYPNFEGFDPDDVSLDSAGKPMTAWFNEGTKIQSFAVQPHAILKLAREQSSQIRARYAPNADYLDVHSAVPPWFHTDFRANVPDGAMFRSVWEAHRALWAFERATYGGPVLGEGANHWFWSGLLDGVEAQFGAGWPDNQGQNAPLAVDFDLLKIHPLQFNHGMGYYERWWSRPTWSQIPPMAVLDQYRMQEVIYGHAGFLGGVASSNVPLAWLEHHLLSPVTARLATAKAVSISYRINGRWVDGTEAAKANRWTRVRVTYDNGLSVVANDDAATLSIGGLLLPQHGWEASGAGVRAWTALCEGTVADYARTPNSTFANARRASDWNQSGVHRVQPLVAQFKQSGPRTFSISYSWRVGENLKSDLGCFVHFTGSGDSLVFQNDHALPRATSTWKQGEVVSDGPHEVRLPDNLPDGDYSVRVGLFDAKARLAMQGHDDGNSRIILGIVRVEDGGKTLTFVPDKPVPNAGDIFEQRLNTSGKVLDFGDIRTNGSVLVRREKGEWVLRALPRVGDFKVELSGVRFGHPATVRAVDGASATIATRAKGDWWELKLNGAREYRWK